jgi:ribonuclease P protein component
MKKTMMLKKNYEFKKVLSKGKYFSGEKIEAFILKNNKEYNLLGIAISVKTGKATKRNRLKRIIRENYKEMEKSLIEGYSIVFLLKRNNKIESINFKFVKEDLEKIFNKAGIRRK